MNDRELACLQEQTRLLAQCRLLLAALCWLVVFALAMALGVGAVPDATHPDGGGGREYDAGWTIFALAMATVALYSFANALANGLAARSTKPTSRKRAATR